MHDSARDDGRIAVGRVRMLRQRRGLSQGQLAVITGISQTHISGIESAATKLWPETVHYVHTVHCVHT